MADSPGDETFLNLWRTGDQAAARQLFERYADRLVALARRRLSQRLGGRVDPEDVVQSVFRTFFQRAKEGQFQLNDPDDLCKLLTRITIHKALRQVVFHTRQKRNATQESGGGDDAQDLLLNVVAGNPDPEETAALLDQMEHFLAQFQPNERKILELRMEGYGTAEIATQLGTSDRTVRRLLERIRAQAQQDWLPS